MRLMKKIAKRKWLACAMIGGALMSSHPLAVWAEDGNVNDSYSFDQIVVTANRIPAKSAEAAANVTVVTREDIDRTDAKTLADVLKNVNGVTVYSSSVGTEQHAALNGDQRVVVMIDGRRLNTSSLGFTGRSTYDLSWFPTLDNVERIEVVQGAGGAQYGADAVGGVINVITRKGAASRTTMNVEYGSWNTGNYSLSQSGGNKDWNWYLTAGAAHRQFNSYKDFRTGNIMNMPNSEHDQNNATLRLDKQLDANSSLTFNFEHVDQHAGQPGGAFPDGWVAYPYLNAYLHTQVNNAALTYNYKSKSELPAFARFYQNNSKYNYYGETASSNSSYTNKETGLEWQDGWRLDKGNLLISGLQWRSTLVDNSSFGGRTIANTGAYLEDRLKLGRSWTFIPGVRYDNNSMFGGQFTPRLALNYQADADTNLYVNWGRVFNAPTADDLFSADTGWTKGNPNLKPETGYTTTFGLNRKLSKVSTLKVSYFFSALNDAIAWAADSSSVWMPVNVDSMTKHGAELSLQSALSSEWNLNLGYSWLQQNTTSMSATEIINPQPNGYRLGLQYAKNKWDAGLNLTMVAGRDLKYYTAANYCVLDLAVNYTMNKNLRLYFKMNNLTDQAYEITGSTSQGLYPMPSRSFQLGAKYTF